MMCYLLVVCSLFPATAEDLPQEFLGFLAATQERTRGRLASLGFDATVLNVSHIPDLGKSLPITSTYHVSRRSGTTIVTWECHTALTEVDEGGGKTRVEVSNKPRGKRVLRTPDSIMATHGKNVMTK